MKKTLAILLAVLLTFSSVSLLGTGTASAEQQTGDVLFTSDYLWSGQGAKWNDTDSILTKMDENGDGTNDFGRLTALESKNKPQIYSPTVQVIPGNSYELSFYVRVPNDANTEEFTYTNQYAPYITIYQPNSTYKYWSEGQNEYAYTGGEEYGAKPRRTDFVSNVTIGEHATYTKDKYSNYGYQVFYNVVGGKEVKLNEALGEWTKMTISFTAIASADNDGPQDVAVSFGFYKKGTFCYDFKDVVFKCTNAVEAPKVQTILKSDFANGMGTWAKYNFTTESKVDENGETYIEIPAHSQTFLLSSPVDLTPGNQYELTFDLRIPSTSAAYYYNNAPIGPCFAIYETGIDSSSGKVTSVPQIDGTDVTKNNLYSDKSSAVNRRSDFEITWELGNKTYTDKGHSLFDNSDHRNVFGKAADSDLQVVYGNWTTIKATFTAVASDANTGAQTVAIAFGSGFNAKDTRWLNVKNIKLVETKAGGSEEEPDEPDQPDTPVESDKIGLNENFENYSVGTYLYNNANPGADPYYVFAGESTKPLTGWGDLTVVSYSGRKAMGGETRYQTAAIPVKLEKNTEYTLSFWYTHNASKTERYVRDFTYGIYVPNTSTQKLQAASGTHITSQKSFAPVNFKAGEWKKLTHTFTTGDDVDNLYFGYRYSVDVSTKFYLDDIIIQPTKDVVKSQIDLDVKSAASVDFVGTNRFDYYVGEKVEFRVVAQEGVNPTVYLDNNVLTANSNGVYSFTAAATQKIKVVCDGDENRLNANTDKNGNSLEQYNQALALNPIWKGNTVYHETALFYTERNTDTIKLLYPISEVISVRSYDLYTNYVEGVDYEITEDGCLKRLEGSRIPEFTKSLTTTKDSGFQIVGQEGVYAQFINDYDYPAYAINVTYEHTGVWADGYTPEKVEDASDELPKVFEKLINGEEVNIVILGDSASAGSSASGLNYINELYKDNGNGARFSSVLNFAPYTPAWPKLVEAQLKTLYPKAKINVENIAIGGKTAKWGADEIAERLGYLGEDWETDLMILGYAPNDLTAGYTSDVYKTYMQNIITNLRNVTPEAEVLLWSHYIPNTDVKQWQLEDLRTYRDKLVEIADANEGVALADTFAVFEEILETKKIADIFNDGVVHGNDFLVRVIAQSLVASLSIPEFKPGDIDGDETTNLKDLVTIAQYVAEWEVNLNKYATDVNGDGVTDLNDVNELARYIAGWSDAFIKNGVLNEYLPASNTLKEVESNLKLNSRANFNDEDRLSMKWSYSGFEIQGQFSGDITLTDVTTVNEVLLYAVLDGNYDNMVQLRINAGNVSKELTILKNINPGFHTVQLFKATEATKANITIGGIKYNGDLFAAPAEKELKIQFIGDSITSASGLYTDEVEPDTLLTNDISKGYAFKVARYFDADMSVVSVSGGTVCAKSPSMKDYYLYNKNVAEQPYDFSTETEPDLVIVSLGTNDTGVYYSTDGKIDEQEEAQLKQGIKDLLTAVREKNPNAKILYAYGMMDVRRPEIYESAVNEFNVTDGNTYYTMISRNDCTGYGGHPTPDGHTLNANEYISFIEENIW